MGLPPVSDYIIYAQQRKKKEMKIINKFLKPFSINLALDLGTSTTKIYLNGEGVVLYEPSLVAIDETKDRIVSIRKEAKRMLGKTPPSIKVVKPLQDSVITDFVIVEKMIKYFIKKVYNHSLFIRPKVAVSVPGCITEVEKRAVIQSIEYAGAREIYLLSEGLASAIGADLPVDEPAGTMVIDIGGGTTEITVISLGSVVVSNSIRIGGDEFDESIINFLRRKYEIVIGTNTAEKIKIEIGSIFFDKAEKRLKMEVGGRDAVKGLPKRVVINTREIREALKESMEFIIKAIKSAFDITPPELVADIRDRGIVLTGGGALLRGIDSFLSKVLGVPVIVPDNPIMSVVYGIGKFMKKI